MLELLRSEDKKSDEVGKGGLAINVEAFDLVEKTWQAGRQWALQKR